MQDLISRQDAIDAVADYIHNVDKVYGTGRLAAEDCRDAAHSVIDELPSAERKGKWIRITQGEMPEQYICPFCHRTVETYGVEELLPIRYPYCHCGADMRGEEE